MELLTETSTQIRVSVRPKAALTLEGQHKIITGTLDFGKCLLRSNFQQLRTRTLGTVICATEKALTALIRWQQMQGSTSSELSGEKSTGKPTPPDSADLAPDTTNPHSSSELAPTALRQGTAARRLLAEDTKLELFQHLPETYSLSHRLRRHGWSTLRYLMQTEVHTYAFSVAANSILSFFPFIVLLLTVVHRVFHSPAMYNVVLQLLRDYLPSNKDFVIRNLQFLASVRGRGQVLSFVMLLITSTGVFLPLEVALNGVWGFKKNRSYLMNLVVSLGLALACGCLAMLSIALTAQNLRVLGRYFGDGFLFQGAEFVVMKATAILATICIYFLIYWLLPNGKRSSRPWTRKSPPRRWKKSIPSCRFRFSARLTRTEPPTSWRRWTPMPPPTCWATCIPTRRKKSSSRWSRRSAPKWPA